MAVAYRSSASRSEQLGGNIVVTKPTGTVDGDLLVAVAISNNGAANPVVAPAGWTLHPSTVSAAARLYYKVASGEGANYTFTQNAFSAGNVIIVCYSGVLTSNPFDAVSGVASTTTGNIVIPALTSGGSKFLGQIVTKWESTTFTPPGTATERFDALSVQMSVGGAGGDETVAAGSTGTRTWDPAGTGSGWAVGYMFTLNTAAQTLGVTGFAPAVTFGTPTVIRDQFVTVTGFAPAVTFGTVSLLREVAPSGFTPSVVFGSPTLLGEINPSGFTVPVLFGTPSLGQTVDVDGFAVPVLFGSPTVILDNVLAVTGFAPAIVFGSPDVDRQPFVTATVYDHETGNPVGAGATVQLFDENGTLLDTTTTDANGDYMFFLPFGFTDNVFTVVRTTIGLIDYQGVSEVCSVST